MSKKWVYLFQEGDASMRNTLGGKGANLAEMTKLGLPVPQGFTVTTEACNQYYEDSKVINKEVLDQIMENIAKLEEIAGQKFGDKENPLLVSVRSGARASMPGMMDTILNLGLNEEVVEVLAEKSGNPRWAYDCYRRFIQMYSDVVMEVGKKYFEALIDKMKAAATYGQSYALAENLAAVTIDMAWGMLPAGTKITDVDAFEREALARAGLDFALVPPRYRSAYYLHVFAGGYASGYYSYLWTEVLDHNIYEWFEAHGGLTRENGQRFREMVLSRGNTAPVGTFFTNFTGLTEPDMSSLLRFRGLTK